MDRKSQHGLVNVSSLILISVFLLFSVSLVQAANDGIPPAWTQVLTNQTVELGTPFVYQANTTDDTPPINYTINDTAHFAINLTTGNITNATTLAVGIYDLQINATDSDTVPKTNSSNINVTVRDTTAPVWAQAPTNRTVNLTTPFVYQVNATDFATITYSLNDTSNFTINSANGNITNATLLRIGIYSLRINATDASNNSLAAYINITVGSGNASHTSTPVNLLSTVNFTILAETGITTTGVTSVIGDMGISPAAATTITGFGLILDASTQFSTSSLVTGKIYAPGYGAPTPAKMVSAQNDMVTAYNAGAGATSDTTIGGSIGGLTLVPGVYTTATSLTIPTDVTLYGGPNDVWIFQVGGTLGISSAKKIILTGGAQPKNIFWIVAGQTTLGTNSVFNGNILDQTGIAIQTGATLNGRALAQSLVTLDGNAVTSPDLINASAPNCLAISVSPNQTVHYLPTTQYQFNITCTDVNGMGNVTLQIDNTNYSATNLGSGIYSYTKTGLSAANHTYLVYANNTAGVLTNTSTYYYNVSKGIPILTTNSSGGWSISYTNATNVSAIGCPSGGADDVTCLIWINGTSAGANSALINLTNTVGVYTIFANSTAGQNWTAATSTPTNLTITQAIMPLTLSIDGSLLNKAINISTNSTINGSKQYAEGVLNLFINGIPAATTGASVSNISNYTTAGIYNISLNFTATQNFSATSTTLQLTVANLTGFVANSTNITVTGNISQIIFTNSTSPENVTITTASETTPVTLNYSLIGSLSGGIMNVTLGADLYITRSIASTLYQVTIPANTTLSGAGWDGGLIAPTVLPFTSVTIIPPNDYTSTTTTEVIVLGSATSSLTFNRGVWLFFPGKSSQHVGYALTTGGAFHEIITTCSSDSQAVGDALAAGTACKINKADGSGLVVWTKHFTIFATYTLTSTGGSSGSGTPVSVGSSYYSAPSSTCTSNWSCSGWTACSQSGSQTRTCADMNSCSGATVPQTTQSCTYVPPTQPPVQNVTPPPPTKPSLVATAVQSVSSGTVGSTVTIKAVSADGTPVPNTVIQITAPNQQQSSIVTDANGNAQLSLDTAGTYTLSIPGVQSAGSIQATAAPKPPVTPPANKTTTTQPAQPAPSTGGSNYTWLIGLVVLVIIIGGIIYYWQSRKKQA